MDQDPFSSFTPERMLLVKETLTKNGIKTDLSSRSWLPNIGRIRRYLACWSPRIEEVIFMLKALWQRLFKKPYISSETVRHDWEPTWTRSIR